MDDESKLTLHGLVQHYIMLHEEEKNRKLTDLLDALEFNQVRRPGGPRTSYFISISSPCFIILPSKLASC